MITQYTIEIYAADCAPYDDYKFTARFSDYDGAPDGNNKYGVGDTHGEAVMNLVENYTFEDER